MKNECIVICHILIIGFCIFLINQYLFQICFVKGQSMQPTLQEGNVIIIKKFNLKLNYNDIVVIKKNNKIIIKRILGLPEDTVNINKYVYINGIQKDSLYTENAGNAQMNITLKKREFFVLGDNRQNSIDSRFDEIGIIKEDEIIGKLLFPNKK